MNTTGPATSIQSRGIFKARSPTNSRIEKYIIFTRRIQCYNLFSRCCFLSDRYLPESMVLRKALDKDPQFQVALELVQDRDMYGRIITPADAKVRELLPTDSHAHRHQGTVCVYRWIFMLVGAQVGACTDREPHLRVVQ